MAEKRTTKKILQKKLADRKRTPLYRRDILKKLSQALKISNAL